MSDNDSIVTPGMVLAERYEMNAEIGRGGFGMVWKARQLNMDRDVAIKVLPPKFMAIPDVVERFKREARLASRLRHPNTITVHDYGKHENLLFIVMELLEGEDLADLLMADATVPIERIVHIARQVLKSLDEAHSHGIVHRDLKPENIYLTQLGAETDFVKVLDFGIAKLAMPELDGKGSDEVRKLTMSGSTVGTPTYMSPEQAAGEQVDAQTDLYALGIIMWEMAAGRAPFKDDNPVKVMRSHLFDEVPPFPDKTLQGTRFEAIIHRAIEKDQEERFHSAMEFFDELDRDVSELMEAVVDEPPTVELDPGIGEINLDPDGQDSEASIAYDRTDTYDSASERDSAERRQNTDAFGAARTTSDSGEESIPFESLDDSDRGRVRENASASSSLTDASSLNDASGLSDRSGLNDASDLNSPPGGFDQHGGTSSSSIITVVEPGPKDEVILLTDPKNRDRSEQAQPEEPRPPAANAELDSGEASKSMTEPDGPDEHGSLDSGINEIDLSAESSGEPSGTVDAPAMLDGDGSSDSWEWGARGGNDSDSFTTSSGPESTIWIFVVLLVIAAAAGGAYLYYSGIFP